MGGMVLKNAGYPGGRAYPHSVPPVARYCTPRCTAYHSTGAAEGEEIVCTLPPGGMRFWALSFLLSLS